MAVNDLIVRLFGGDAVSRDEPVGHPAAKHIVLVAQGNTLLVPLRPRQARLDAVSATSSEERAVERAGRRLARAALHSELATVRLGSPVWIHTGEDSLCANIEDLLDHAVNLSARFGPPRPNQKPVLRVTNSLGELVAFAKIGWDPLTRELVRHERSVLTELSSKASSMIEWASIAGFSTWRDLDLLITRPIEIRQSRTHRSPVAATDAIARLGDRTTGRLESLPFWRRVSTFLGPGHAEQIAKRAAETEVCCGFSHGDWTPWNMVCGPDKVGVWDWERAAHGVPVGLDALHFEYQRLLHRSAEPESAFAEALRSVRTKSYETSIMDDGVLAGIYAAWMADRFTNAPPEPSWLPALRHRAAQLIEAPAW